MDIGAREALGNARGLPFSRVARDGARYRCTSRRRAGRGRSTIPHPCFRIHAQPPHVLSSDEPVDRDGRSPSVPSIFDRDEARAWASLFRRRSGYPPTSLARGGRMIGRYARPRSGEKIALIRGVARASPRIVIRRALLEKDAWVSRSAEVCRRSRRHVCRSRRIQGSAWLEYRPPARRDGWCAVRASTARRREEHSLGRVQTRFSARWRRRTRAPPTLLARTDWEEVICTGSDARSRCRGHSGGQVTIGISRRLDGLRRRTRYAISVAVDGEKKRAGSSAATASRASTPSRACSARHAEVIGYLEPSRLAATCPQRNDGPAPRQAFGHLSPAGRTSGGGARVGGGWPEKSRTADRAGGEMVWTKAEKSAP